MILKLKAAIVTLLIQSALALIFLGGMLLDPLLGFWIAIFYFVVVLSFLIYKVTFYKLMKHDISRKTPDKTYTN